MRTISLVLISAALLSLSVNYQAEAKRRVSSPRKPSVSTRLPMQWSGNILRVVDARPLAIAYQGKPVRVRLAGIVVPSKVEPETPAAAKKYLHDSFVDNRLYKVVLENKGRRERDGAVTAIVSYIVVDDIYHQLPEKTETFLNADIIYAGMASYDKRHPPSHKEARERMIFEQKIVWNF